MKRLSAVDALAQARSICCHSCAGMMRGIMSNGISRSVPAPSSSFAVHGEGDADAAEDHLGLLAPRLHRGRAAARRATLGRRGSASRTARRWRASRRSSPVMDAFSCVGRGSNFRTTAADRGSCGANASSAAARRVRTRTSRRAMSTHRNGRVRTSDDAAPAVARQHLRRRVAEAAAVAGLHHRHRAAAPHRASAAVDDVRLPWCGTSSSRCAARRRARATSAASCSRLDVAGEQHAARRRHRHAQHARHRVRTWCRAPGHRPAGAGTRTARHPTPTLAGFAAASCARGQRRRSGWPASSDACAARRPATRRSSDAAPPT